VCDSQGQGAIVPAESLSDVTGTEFLGLLNFSGLSDSVVPQELEERLLLDNFKDILSDAKISEPRWNIEANNFYASGQSASYFGEGLYSDLRLEHRAKIAGLPVGLSGGLILQNNRVNSRLSTISVEFDHESFLNKHRERLGERAIQESFHALTDAQKRLLNEHFLLERARQTLLGEQHQSLKNTLAHRVDSLGRFVPPKTDSTLLDSLQKEQRDIEKTERFVDSLYRASLSKWNETQQAIQEWRAKVMEQHQALEEKIETGTLHKYAEKKRGWKSWLMNISRFQLGSFRLRNSPFDVSSVPLHGLGMEIRRNGYYASINYGKEGRQQRQLPGYVQNLRLAGEGRTILQAKAGIGMPERSHLHLTFSSIQVRGATGDSIYAAFPKRNVLMSLSSRYLVSEQFFVEMTGSVSSADFTGAATSKELASGFYEGRNNTAGMFNVGWRSRKGHSEYTVGCQMVGDNFVTLGNLFLLNNRNTLRLEGKQRFLHDRGQLKVLYLKGSTSNETEITPGVQQDQFSGELSFRLDKRGSKVWARYSPSYYLQSAPGSSSTVYQLNLATAGAQWMFKRGKKGQWATMLQLTNFADQSQYGDTSVVTGIWYGMLTQSYSSDKYMATVLANVGMDKDKLRSVKDFNLDISQSWRMKSLQFTQGVQAVKRFYGSGFLIGGSGGFQFYLKGGLRAGLSGTYYIGVSQGETNQFYLNTSVGWQF
jgi:hypothetical protein